MITSLVCRNGWPEYRVLLRGERSCFDQCSNVGVSILMQGRRPQHLEAPPRAPGFRELNHPQQFSFATRPPASEPRRLRAIEGQEPRERSVAAKTFSEGRAAERPTGGTGERAEGWEEGQQKEQAREEDKFVSEKCSSVGLPAALQVQRQTRTCPSSIFCLRLSAFLGGCCLLQWDIINNTKLCGIAGQKIVFVAVWTMLLEKQRGTARRFSNV